MLARLDSIREQMSILLATADQGRILREGVRVVIYGATNAGKSSLLNRLLGYERVIVSESPGTTRDTIEEMINLRGLPIRLLDTAGLRPEAKGIEREGIARTKNRSNWRICSSISLMATRRGPVTSTMTLAGPTRSWF